MSGLPADAKVAVLGSGTMGRGIARVAAGAGHEVVLFDVSREALDSAAAELHRYLQRDVEKDRLEVDEAAAIGERITYTADVAGVGGADLTIEAIVDRFRVKDDLRLSRWPECTSSIQPR